MCSQLHMSGLVSESTYFILAPKDVVVARPCNSDDHVTWLLENGLFKKALDFVTNPPKDRHFEQYSHAAVARLYVDYLLSCDRFSEAAELLPTACENRRDTWEQYVNKFDELGCLKYLAPYIPTNSPRLEPECYEVLLSDFLKTNIAEYKKLITSWSPDLYRVGAVIKDALDKLYKQSAEMQTGAAAGISPKNREDLLETLALLYTYQRDTSRALALYLKLSHKAAFDLIERYGMFDQVKDKIQELMKIDKDLAIRLLLNNEDRLPMAAVVKQLSAEPTLQLAYLDRLFSKGEGTSEFADMAVLLYAQHDRARMLKFLKSCGQYNLDKALAVTKQHRLLEEMVFLLAKSGNSMEALRVIISEAQDIGMAIEFCKEHDDEDLWRELIKAAVNSPEMTKVLLQSIGTHVDPKLMIDAINPKMQIEGLRDCLVKILRDYSMQINLQEGCRRVMISDCHNQAKRLLSTRRQGITVSRDATCIACGGPLVTLDPRVSQPLRVFSCGHGSHHAERCGRSRCSRCVVEDYS